MESVSLKINDVCMGFRVDVLDLVHEYGVVDDFWVLERKLWVIYNALIRDSQKVFLRAI